MFVNLVSAPARIVRAITRSPEIPPPPETAAAGRASVPPPPGKPGGAKRSPASLGKELVIAQWVLETPKGPGRMSAVVNAAERAGAGNGLRELRMQDGEEFGTGLLTVGLRREQVPVLDRELWAAGVCESSFGPAVRKARAFMPAQTLRWKLEHAHLKDVAEVLDAAARAGLNFLYSRVVQYLVPEAEYIVPERADLDIRYVLAMYPDLNSLSAGDLEWCRERIRKWAVRRNIVFDAPSLAEASAAWRTMYHFWH